MTVQYALSQLPIAGKRPLLYSLSDGKSWISKKGESELNPEWYRLLPEASEQEARDLLIRKTVARVRLRDESSTSLQHSSLSFKRVFEV